MPAKKRSRAYKVTCRSCGRGLRKNRPGQLCHTCLRVDNRHQLLRDYSASGTVPRADPVADPIRAARVDTYEARAAAGLPLFDPPLPGPG